jgi:hypothetical protein
MEQRPYWQADSHSASQEILHLLCNPKVHYQVHKIPRWSLLWARCIQSRISDPISLRYIVLLFSHLRLGLPSGLFPSGFPSKILFPFLILSATCPTHRIILHLITLIIYCEAYIQVMKFLSMQSSLASRHFLPLRFKYSAQHLVRHPQFVFFPHCMRLSFTPIQKRR